MKKSLRIFGLLCFATILLGCSDKDEATAPEYKLLDRLELRTGSEDIGSTYSRSRGDAIWLMVLGDLTLLEDLRYARMTLCPDAESDLYFRNALEPGNPEGNVISVREISLSWSIGSWSLDGPTEYFYSFGLTLPALNGDYDFRLRIEHPDKGLYYHTPKYRLTVYPARENYPDFVKTKITRID